MSRRKQSNPKPLKVEDEWNEEGGRKPENESKKVGDEEQEESPSSQESPSDFTIDKPQQSDADTTYKDGPASHSSQESHEKGLQDEKDLKIPVFPKVVKVKRESGERGEGAEPRLRSQSRSSNLTEFSEVIKPQPEESDGRRKRRRESESSSTRRNKSPELPEQSGSGEMNGTLTMPLSSQQLLQGLPYLHLLPPSMRNDAARLLFMPPLLPPESSNSANAVDSEKSGGAENLRCGPGYFCKPCNIKFSSARTLDAHQTYYCSFRREIGEKDSCKTEHLDTDSNSKGELTPGQKKRERESGDEDRELMIEESMDVSPEGRVGFNELMPELNPNKISKTGKLYTCMYCCYSADKKVSLNRHMRMHSGSISANAVSHQSGTEDSGHRSGSTTPSITNNIGLNKNLPEGVNALERYCQDCDIQFSSIKTYRVHKQHYCRTRHVLKTQQGGGLGSPPGMNSMKVQSSGEMGGNSLSVTPVRKNSGSPAPSLDGSPVSTPMSSPPQPFVVLPTNPLIVVPYCFIQAASILPGNVLPSQNALVVLPNGSVQGLPFTTVPGPVPSPSPVSHAQLSLLSQSSFSSGGHISNKNSNGGHSSLSPNNPSHSVFNDPKDILRKITCANKSSAGYDSTVSSGYKTGSSPNDLNNTCQNVNQESAVSENGTRAFRSTDEDSDKSNQDEEDTQPGMRRDGDGELEGNEEGMPAIDLTLRKTRSIKEISGDEEKENREVCLRLQNQNQRDGEQMPGSNSYTNDDDGVAVPSGKKSSSHSTTTNPFTDFHRDREISSPSERGSSGKKTPRPSSTSISSSCSTPPALLCEPKVNGVGNRHSSPLDHEQAANVNSKGHPHSLITMMISPSMPIGKGQGSMDFSGLDMVKHQNKLLGGGEGKGKRGGKISHNISTQLPGGAILTTSAGGGHSQSLTDLLIPNSPEFNEILAKISPQLLLNSPRPSPSSGSSQMVGLNPALLQALSQSDPEILMRMLDPTYLANLQQTIQQQQAHASGKRGYSKCVECDIVFYKHENYLVHKEHYCAARTANGSPTNMNNNCQKEEKSSRGCKQDGGTSSSRISTCSSPAKSEIDADDSRSSPSASSSCANIQQRTSSTSNQNQMNIKVPRKSTDSSSSDFFPVPVYEKTKTKSPQEISSSSISISPIPSPNERKEKVQIQLQNCAGSQYPCLHCGVKYSTIDNLKAHQNFYCTKRRNEKDSSALLEGEQQHQDLSVEPDYGEGYVMSTSQQQGAPLLGHNNKGLLQCRRCKLAIPEDQLGPHSKVCLGSNGAVVSYGSGPVMGLLTSASGDGNVGGGRGGGGVGWKCPCCDTYSPTVSQAQKHLEVHTGIKAFKCLLCGYRGNTLRGMRTHIRTHFDKRVSDLLEGEYMTCITANDVDHNASTPLSHPINKSFNATTSSDTKVNHHHAELPNNRQGGEKNKLNHLRSATSPGSLSLELQQDVKIFSSPEESSSSTMMEKVENNNRASNCTLCTYTSSYRGNIIRHMKLVHKISEESADKILTEMTNSIVKVHSNNSTSEELLDDYQRDSLDRKLNLLPSPKNIHIKEFDDGPILSNNIASSGMENTGNQRRNKNINGRGGVGKGRDNKSDGECGERNCTSRSSSPEEEEENDQDKDGLSTLQKKEKPCAVKYCKSCDIYFNHLSTFDAHRKSYCSAAAASLNNKAAERAETPVQ